MIFECVGGVPTVEANTRLWSSQFGLLRRRRTKQPLTETDLKGLQETSDEIGEEDGASLFSDLLARSGLSSLAHLVRSPVGMDRAAAQAAFSEFLNERTLTSQQIRFIEIVIVQLTARGIMEASALYEAPFKDLHSGGPDALFKGKENVIDGVFTALKGFNRLGMREAS